MNFVEEVKKEEGESRPRIQSVTKFVRKYERHISSIALLFGFVFDNLTLQRIDLLYENVVLFLYLFVAGFGIFLINFFDRVPPEKVWLYRVRSWLPILVQFAFGGLFSGFLVFYSRSATLTTSWPFMLILVAILVGNEVLKKYYLRLTFQVSIFFTALFSFSIFYVPIVVGSIGAGVFVLSGVVSLVAIAGFVYLLYLIIPQRIKAGLRLVSTAVIAIFTLITSFYFLNILPPIPLSLKDVVVAHRVERVADEYRIIAEERPWYGFVLPSTTIHIAQEDPVYVYGSIFAPTDLKTTIAHQWQYFDDSLDMWVDSTKVSFPINGGRGEGYRGYSFKQNVFPGKWRVNIETIRGQVIGRVVFWVEYVTFDVETETFSR